MESIADIQITDYTYELPQHRIAKKPLEQRDESKLLVYQAGNISHIPFKNIADLIPEGNLLIRNNTRVIQARLGFRKTSGARIEIFCLEPVAPAGYEPNFASTGFAEWKCLVGNARKWKEGPLQMKIKSGDIETNVRAVKSSINNDNFNIRFEWDNLNMTFADLLERAGSTPIPPYLNRKAGERDKKWYQTVYASLNGSVAAPTAGLHFTSEVFNRLENKNIEIDEVTLHVGAGTFRPVQKERISDHEMHLEATIVKRKTVEKILRQSGKGITAVGTTSLRTLESLYWMGVRLENQPEINPDNLLIGQWEPYKDNLNIPSEKSMENLLAFFKRNALDEISFATQLIIVPGYRFRIVNRLITNFHQPGSTLLLLVAAFAGQDWKRIYRYALDNGFRFLSYGDSSILELNNTIN